MRDAIAIEGNRAIACMGSWGHAMPRTDDTFVESARRVRARWTTSRSRA